MQCLGWCLRKFWGLIPNCSSLLGLQVCPGDGPEPARVNVHFPHNCRLFGWEFPGNMQPTPWPGFAIGELLLAQGDRAQGRAGQHCLECRSRLLTTEPRTPNAHFPGDAAAPCPCPLSLQLCFRGAGLLQACTTYAPCQASHPPLPVSGRFLTSESFQFCYWRAPADFLLHACSSYISVSCFMAVLRLFEIRAFLPIFHGSFLPLSFAVIETVLKNNPKVHLFKNRGFLKPF